MPEICMQDDEELRVRRRKRHAARADYLGGRPDAGAKTENRRARHGRPDRRWQSQTRKYSRVVSRRADYELCRSRRARRGSKARALNKKRQYVLLAKSSWREEGLAWLVHLRNDWSDGFQPEWGMQALPDAFERLRSQRAQASACAGRFCWLLRWPGSC